VRKIKLAEVTEAVKRLCIEACCLVNEEMSIRFQKALQQEESPIGVEVLTQIIENAQIATAEFVPMCQDTGVTVVFVELGEEVGFEGSGLIEAINRGVAEGYREGYLRKSMVRDPLRRQNTKDNTPAIVHIDLVPGDRLKIKVAAKGGGAENMSALKMLHPADGLPGVIDFVLEVVKKAGPNACPPLVVGVGIGGNLEKSALLAKKALFRPLGQRHPDPFYAQLEEELMEKINKLGIGPQGMGGTTTALDVHIEVFPCHIASLPVAVNLDCHAHRHKEVIF
jgi:fumarate hydratase subunit alpha